MTAMDCARCEPLLLDLVAEELPPDAAELARAHVRSCTACGEAYAKLEAGMRVARELPDVEPPPEVTARVIALAEAHVRARGVSAQPRAPTSVRPLAGLRDWLDSLGRFSMEHQVGMAIVFLVVIAVGAWSLPKLRHLPDVAGGAVVNPDASGEAAPSSGLQPAEPLDLKVDRRSGRIRSADEGAAEPARTSVAAPSAPAPAAAPGDDSEYALAEQAQGAGAEKPAPKDKDEGAMPAVEQEGKAVAPATESIAALRARVVPQPTMPAKRGEPNAFPGTATGASADRADRGSADDLLMDALAAPKAKAVKGDVQGLGSSSLAEPEAAPAAAGPAGRTAAPAQASAATSAASLLRDARATRTSSGCVAALSRYRAVSTSYPGTPEAGEALLDRARCLTQLGRIAEARADLRQAARIASSAERAKARLGTEATTKPFTNSYKK